MSKRQSSTQKVELVETHNLALSFGRLTSGPYDAEKWRRALYHALAMNGCSRGMLEKVRVALELP